MYEMSFLWNNNVCCGCTGFLHILWAFIAANMREGEGHNRLLISWMQEFPTVRRGGSESQHGFSASSESVKQATFIKWLWRFLSWWWKGQSPNRKPEPPRQLPASLKEQKGGGNTNICEEAVCADLAWICHTLCFWGRLCGEQVIFSTEITWASITTTAGVWHSSLGTRRIPRSGKQLI